MNARLLILGVLYRGDFHPYEIKRRIEAAMVECYLNVDVGTLYYAVRQLEKEGLITAVVQERVARGGMRTIYRITDEGRSQFMTGLRGQLEVEGPVSNTLYGALLFLHLADPNMVEEALARRIRHQRDLIEKLGPIREQMTGRIATGGHHLLGHIERQRRLDLEWLETLLADIQENGIRDVANPEALAAPKPTHPSR